MKPELILFILREVWTPANDSLSGNSIDTISSVAKSQYNFFTTIVIS